MSVVIIGGHDRMVCQYKKICKSHKCKAKVFTQMSADLDSRLVILIYAFCLQIPFLTKWYDVP